MTGRGPSSRHVPEGVLVRGSAWHVAGKLPAAPAGSRRPARVGTAATARLRHVFGCEGLRVQ